MPTLRIVFSATDATNGTELWVTDGTTAGTSLLKDIYPAGSGFPLFIAAIGNNQALFQANDKTHGAELWTTDGTPSGTSMLVDVDPRTSGGFAFSGNPTGIAAVGGGQVLFSGVSSSLGREIWTTDGTAPGTSVLLDLFAGTDTSHPDSFTIVAPGRIVFSARDNSHGTEPFVTDGTAAGTSLLVDINPGTSGLNPLSSYPSLFTPLGNGRTVFFAANFTLGSEPWVTDGTSAGTSMLLDIHPSGNSTPSNFTPMGDGRALFQASSTNGAELWITDGTTANTSLVKNINSRSAGASSTPQYFAGLGDGRFVFQATDGTTGAELWITDGTAANTSLLKDIVAGSGGSSPAATKATGTGKVVFRATDAAHGSELWVTDGTAAGTSLLADINPGTASGNPTLFFPTGNGQLLFRADDGSHGGELWITDGTAAGTSLLADINAGASASSPSGFATVVPCFAAGTRVLTAAGERPVEAIVPGDLIPTASGRLRRVVWVGHTAVDLDRHPSHASAAPIRLAAGALADNIPARDLRLSPDHALLIDGALVPARLLVNGASIRQEPASGRVRYIHIELDAHDALLAEGAPCESFLDTGNRAQFAGESGARPLHADFAISAWDARACAPLLLAGTAIATIRARLAARAAEPVRSSRRA